MRDWERGRWQHVKLHPKAYWSKVAESGKKERNLKQGATLSNAAEVKPHYAVNIGTQVPAAVSSMCHIQILLIALAISSFVCLFHLIHVCILGGFQ